MLITTEERNKFLETADQTLQPFICEENVEVVCDNKFLAIQIDESLTCKIQLRLLTDKASRAISFLKYARQFLPEVH